MASQGTLDRLYASAFTMFYCSVLGAGRIFRCAQPPAQSTRLVPLQTMNTYSNMYRGAVRIRIRAANINMNARHMAGYANPLSVQRTDLLVR